ncbi:hypothetical protein LN042_22560 [Kitasatospora sp. RB6PN24]|uniref:hypothetical protein n=1 Tax=Kitasatospora humi TaxID=2893891 RepID=UPI001E593E18|nr:hypothetical protein [Kitasatospora humi]MCC9309817.1 hypothetical protein [Kitasatospora humi]
MDPDQAVRLVRQAIADGICDPGVAGLLAGGISAACSPVRVDSMRRIYERRLRRSTCDARHLDATRALVVLLRRVHVDTLAMITIDGGTNGYEMFLAGADVSRITFWMKMFSRPPG